MPKKSEYFIMQRQDNRWYVIHKKSGETVGLSDGFQKKEYAERWIQVNSAH